MISYDLFFIYVMSIVAFMIYAWDKHQAACQRGRVPEAVLLLLAFLWGGFGALCAMVFCHHKTQKTAFLVCVPIAVCLQIAVSILLRLYVF